MVTRYRQLTKENKDAIVEFYKTNSTLVTSEQFNITPETVNRVLEEYNIPRHDGKTNRELTSLAKYGVTNVGKLESGHEKARQTCLERHGSANFRNVEKHMQTRVKNAGSIEASYAKGVEVAAANNLEKYGVEWYSQLPEWDEKCRVTNNERYGADYYRQTQAYTDSYTATCNEKYGVDHYSQTETYKQQIIDTCNERFGADSWFGSEQGKQSVKDSCVAKYGHESAMQSEEVKQLLKQSFIDNYGVENPMQIPEVRSKLAKNSRNSKLEDSVAVWLTQSSIKFEQHFVMSSDIGIHEFDFAVFDDEQLTYLIDCDGTYYHGYLDDQNGKSVFAYPDQYRMLLVPEGVNFIVVTEHDWKSTLTEYLLTDVDYKQKLFEWCRSFEFPYPVINNVEDSYKSLLKSDVAKFSMNARYGQRVIDKFHKSIWHAHKHNFLSPYDAWQDDSLLNKCIDNRIIYKGSNLDPSKVLYGFSAAKIAPKVSVFNPYLAKYLISKYLNRYDTIFDPCSGYSGRLLGAVSLNKHYVGQDINKITVKETNDLIEYFNLDATVSCVDSLKTKGDYDCLFTCPPYRHKELWGQDDYNMSCDEWITNLIQQYTCKDYLFVVDETTLYEDYIVEELTNKSHLSTSTEKVILIKGDSL